MQNENCDVRDHRSADTETTSCPNCTGHKTPNVTFVVTLENAEVPPAPQPTRREEEPGAHPCAPLRPVPLPAAPPVPPAQNRQMAGNDNVSSWQRQRPREAAGSSTRLPMLYEEICVNTELKTLHTLQQCISDTSCKILFHSFGFCI